ncbi:hypothetical protein H4R33_003808 [Dimargaris cristalligena]|uniref:Uncharacterized protein n=1 Tax=Dimargaris cristalligena TaxID=215637 RepID=A0A4P9ZW25_9FUNG|nr:hypothetical protein H4R33_003808 [Dimargaris cristalligena]RKP37151.1 hypothetical protein BJ085DRAFT_31072 [Dimargaris cristalligena]|eukprot:RKP37151.1 hypothetical protein BJ085DRAFT_31072 [Dimargaris cristalligena]
MPMSGSLSSQICESALTSAARDLFYISESDSPFDYFFIPADELERCGASNTQLPPTAAEFAAVMYRHETHTNLRHVLMRCANAGRVRVCVQSSDEDQDDGSLANLSPDGSMVDIAEDEEEEEEEEPAAHSREESGDRNHSHSRRRESGPSSDSSSGDSLYASAPPFRSRIQSLDEFFGPLLFEETSMGQHRQFKELRDRFYLMFTTDLGGGGGNQASSNPATARDSTQWAADIMAQCCVYRIGQREVGIYVAGILPRVGIAGLKTLAVET